MGPMTPPSGRRDAAEPRRGSAAVSRSPRSGSCAALALSGLTGRVGDWFVMTDELLYERFAISSARSLSPLAALHGSVVASLDQLYPLLIAPIYRAGLVPEDLHRAHLLNAWLMSSACIPAFLLARRVTGSRRAAYVLALPASACRGSSTPRSCSPRSSPTRPSSGRCSRLQRASAAPSRRNDLLALAGLALAFLARTQFLVLAGRGAGRDRRCSSCGRARLGAPADEALARFGLRRAPPRARARLPLAAAVAVVLAALGRLHARSGPTATRSAAASRTGSRAALLEHFATLALGVGILPGVSGSAWFGANSRSPAADRERHAFACLRRVTLAAVVAPGHDLRSPPRGRAVVYDRYLFYLAPVLLLGLICALTDRPAPRFSLLVGPALLVAAGLRAQRPTGLRVAAVPDAEPRRADLGPLPALVRISHGMGSARAHARRAHRRAQRCSTRSRPGASAAGVATVARGLRWSRFPSRPATSSTAFSRRPGGRVGR